MVEFGRRLKQLRQNAGLTQKQLAQKMGITASVVSYYELSERNPSPEILIKLSYIFHTTTDYLLGLDSPPKYPLDLSGLSDDDIQFLQQTIDMLKRKR